MLGGLKEVPKKRRKEKASQNSAPGPCPQESRSQLSESLIRQAQLNPTDRANSHRSISRRSRALTGGLSKQRSPPEQRTASRSKNHTIIPAPPIDGTDRIPSRDKNRSRYVKRGRKSESPLSRVSESSTSNGGHWKSK
ncbi:hypothetical protein Tco_0662917 [Tanacetum coccineum]